MSYLNDFFETNYYWLTKSRKWVTLLMFFSLPLSKSAPEILVLLLGILWAIEPSKNKIDHLKNNHLSVFLIILYIIHPLSLLWSDDVTFGLQRSLDYIWLLFIAIAISQYESEKFRSYLSSFVAGASIHAIFFYLGYFEIFHFLGSTTSDPAISGNRNTYGPIVAISSISMIYLTMTSTWANVRKFLGLSLALLLLITVLLNTSRTGHMVLITLASTSILYVTVLHKKKLLGTISIGALFLALLVSVQTVDSFKKRIEQAVNAIKIYEINPLTSTGVRISFYQNTIELQSERSLTEQLIGSGVGDYVDDFNAFIDRKQQIFPGLRENKEDIQGWNRFRDLHSQFLMNLLKFGYFGITLIIILAILVYSQVKENKNAIMTGLFISVFLALLVNSLTQSAMETRGLAPTYFLILGILFTDFQKKTNTNE